MIAIIAVVALACIMGAQAQAPSSLPPPFAIPLNSSATVTPALITGACTGQGSLPVCNPLSTSGMTYIDCKGKKVASCRSGTVFDYVSRKCLRPNVASKCPSYMCPVTGGAALGRPYGTFGQTGNLTLRLPTRDSFRVICPVNGHCQGGMTFQVNVACPAPPERYPYVWMIDWDTVRDKTLSAN